MSIWESPGNVELCPDQFQDSVQMVACWKDPAARVLEITGSGRAHDLVFHQVSGDYDPQTCFFLGVQREDDPQRSAARPLFVRLIATAPFGVRELLETVSVDQSKPIFAAIALASWHAAAAYCSQCGSETSPESGGRSRICDGCKREEFPRLDPAIIVAVRDKSDRLLLARQAVWEEGRRSVLAGFVEVGESAEQTVHREVFEEVGIKLRQVAYVGSQPWPFPRSLMLAYRALAVTTDLHVATSELQAAGWFTREEVVAEHAAKRLVLPSKHSIASWLINDWLGKHPR